VKLALPAEKAHGPSQPAVNSEEEVSKKNYSLFWQKKAEVTRRVARCVNGDEAFKARNGGPICQGFCIRNWRDPQSPQPTEWRS